jgi:hypothetical protein
VRRLVAQYLCQKALPRATRALLHTWSEAADTHPQPRISASEPSGDGDGDGDGHGTGAYGRALSPGAEVFLAEMPAVVLGLGSGDLGGAEAWTLGRRMQLGHAATLDLTFDLARLRFLRLLQEPYSASQLAAVLAFAERQFAVFYEKYEADIQALLLELLAYGMPAADPAADPVSPGPGSPATPSSLGSLGAERVESIERYTARLKRKIVRHCSLINGLPGDGVSSTFEILLNIGIAANPIVSTALKFVKTTAELTNHNDTSNKRQKTLFDLETSGLPMDFKIKPEHRYHSVFCCPVSRQPATDSDPPVLLPCGHAMLMSSMKSLPRRNNKFKCPTCYGPAEEANVLPLTI